MEAESLSENDSDQRIVRLATGKSRLDMILIFPSDLSHLPNQELHGAPKALNPNLFRTFMVVESKLVSVFDYTTGCMRIYCGFLFSIKAVDLV